jgi:heat shock protein HslJ
MTKIPWEVKTIEHIDLKHVFSATALCSLLFIFAAACVPAPGGSEAEPAAEDETPLSAVDLEGTKWTLVSFGPADNPVVPINGTEMTAAFDNSNQMHGSTGCNNYFTTFTIDGRSFATTEVAQTKKACLAVCRKSTRSRGFLPRLPEAR